MPSGAMVRTGECRFERDMCGWKNATEKSSPSWRMATSTRRPANLADKTFGSPGKNLISKSILINMIINFTNTFIVYVI